MYFKQLYFIHEKCQFTSFQLTLEYSNNTFIQQKYIQKKIKCEIGLDHP